MIGITMGKARGLGDRLQFSSVPENYFRQTGFKLIDMDNNWFFDHNPYVIRGAEPSKVVDLWNFSPLKYDWPVPEAPRPPVYLSNAEIWTRRMELPTTPLIRPRLYQHEDFPFEKREKIYLHTDGKSHGALPEEIVQYVVKKYGPTGQLRLIGLNPAQDYGLEHVKTETPWDLAKLLSEARMLIGCDSGPSWVAACFPDVIIKKVRTRPSMERYDTWTPLEVRNHHAHWDDRLFQIYVPDAEKDVGAFQSYRKM